MDANSKFLKLADEWREKSRFESSASKMVSYDSYQKIIEMGEEAIRPILMSLMEEPDHWFYALCVITGENPVPEEFRGHLEKMSEAWLEWGRINGYIK